MKKLLYAIVLVTVSSVALGTESTSKNNYVSQNRLPEKVIDPQSYQDINAPVRYISTEQLVQRGYRILEYAPPSTRNTAGYQPHYDPSIHKDVYMRIPKTSSQIFGKRWQ